MARRKQIPARWSLISAAHTDKLHSPDSSQVIAPSIPSSPLTPLLGGLMPNRDHNEDLVHCLKSIAPGDAATQPLFSVFAADPFLKAKPVARRLLEKGYRRVVNWPTTAQYGPEFYKVLDSVGLGPR